MKTVNQVYATTDYSLFKKLSGNRILNKLHVERLKTSFKNVYLLAPIIVNEAYEVIDGQHRLEAASSLNLPINFIVVNGYGLKEVQVLNTNMSNWKKEDYLNAYCDLGYPAYLSMRKFMIDFPDFGVGVAEQLITNSVGGANNSGIVSAIIDGKEVGKVKQFQEGRLKISNLELAYDNANKVLDFKEYYEGYNRNTFVAALIGLVGIFKNPNYDHAKMISKLKGNPNAMYHCNNASQYKEMIEEIFNFRSREKVSLRF